MGKKNDGVRGPLARGPKKGAKETHKQSKKPASGNVRNK